MNHEILKEKALHEGHLLTASIELTQYCNFKCLHCYCPTDKKYMSCNDVKSCIDKLYAMGVLYLTFTGGEVFIHEDFEKIYLYAKKRGFIISIMSNLSYVPGKIKDVLLDYPPKAIMITLYGTNEGEYTHFTLNKNAFRKVIDNIDFLHSNNISFMLKAILSKATIGAVLSGEFDKIAETYGKQVMYDPIIFPQKDLVREKLEQRVDIDSIIKFEQSSSDTVDFWKKSISTACSQTCIKCGGGINSFSIDAEGNASICSLYVEDKIDFLKNSTSVIKNHLRNSHYRMQSYYTNSNCSKCEKKSICRWCAAYANLEHGNPSGSIDYMCELAHRRLSAFTEK